MFKVEEWDSILRVDENNWVKEKEQAGRQDFGGRGEGGVGSKLKMLSNP